MDNFIVSARKYRPVTFGTVVGQGHITNTLKNAIKTGHLAQAFLFCGPRGVGKTTCARILAKTINCSNRTENIEACDECESCKSFNEGASHNVFELDAASNNSVDDIRNLIDQVRYAPQLGNYKVYVIDEVHMLSTNAFNAFLKTLEEPPKHAIFILATTEKHKIIPTILSRCQIFDFNRIQIEDIASQLAFIAKSENVTADADALHIIAQKADGAMRDACSIFDQIVSFAGNVVTYKNVIDNLNILDYDYYFKIADAILAENIPDALLIFNEILNNGFDGHNFIAGLGDHFRNLLVSKDAVTLQLLEVGNNIKERYKLQSEKCTLVFLVKGLTILNRTDIQYKSSKNQRLQVELALMQLCSINTIPVDTEKKNDIIKPPSKKEAAKPAEYTVNTASATQVVKEPAPANHQPEATKEQQPTTNNQQPTTNNTPPKKPVIKSGPSINQHINPVKKTENTVETNQEIKNNSENKTEAIVTQEALETAWNKYANDLKTKGKSIVGIEMLSKKPLLMENSVIEFMVASKASEESFNLEKMNLVGTLRKELNNSLLHLNLTLPSADNKTKAYSAEERYNTLAEKNPAIHKLRQVFDLGIE